MPRSSSFHSWQLERINASAPPADVAPAHPCTLEHGRLAGVWSDPNRSDHLARAAGSSEAASACLAHGKGLWCQHRDPTYVLSRSLVPGAVGTRKWAGRCDDLRRSSSAPRHELAYQWVPVGAGCESLLQARAALPDTASLVRDFCARHGNRTVAFVGDSIQQEFWMSFVSLFASATPGANLTAREPQPGAAAGCHLQQLDNVYERPWEVDLPCAGASAGNRTIRTIFLRNEHLFLGEPANDAHQKGAAAAKKGAPKHVSCDWRQTARDADLLVLNRGQWWATDAEFQRELRDTLVTLRALRGRALSHDEVVYRGTHRSMPGCRRMADPLPVRYNATPHYSGIDYWHALERQNQIARRLVAGHGAAYMDVHYASSWRPGGRMPGECVHFCLPGPIDDWSRLLLAFW